MIEKIKAGWNVLHAGECVADPYLWKKHQINSNMLAAFIVAVVSALKAFGNVEIPLDEKSAMAIGGGVLAIVNVVLTMATSDKIGMPAKPAADDSTIYDDPDKPRNDRVDYGGGN